jgi:hypothetical protein
MLHFALGVFVGAGIAICVKSIDVVNQVLS